MRLNSKALSERVLQLEGSLGFHRDVKVIALVGVSKDNLKPTIIGYFYKRDYLLGKHGDSLDELAEQIKQDHPKELVIIAKAIIV
jgi:hypothetical protein